MPQPFWRRNVLLWAIISFSGYCFAVTGPLFVVGGILSLYADPHGSLQMRVLGVPVQTVREKLVLTLLNLVIGALGIRFVASAPLFKAIRQRGITRQ
jgi:hypothetical protein